MNFLQRKVNIWKREEKELLKPLSFIKKVSQDFGLLIKKAVKFSETVKYATASVPVSATTPKSTLYQADKSGFRNYIINLPKSSSHEYSKDVKWVVDELVATRSVPSRAAYEGLFKTLVTFDPTPGEA